jgi:phosphatidylglycerophosphate synthase
MVKQIPNFVSLSRIVFGYLVLNAVTTHNDWRSAFFWFAAGAATDYLDGWLAIKLNAVSEFGKRWVDPVCDFLLGVFVMLAFVFQDSAWQERLWWAIPMTLLAVVGKFVKEQSIWPKAKRIAYLAAPIYYCGCAIIFLYLYAQRGLTDSEMMFINLATIPSIIAAAYFKRHRLSDWTRYVWARPRTS